MCVFHMNSPNRFGAKSIGIGLRSHVNVVIEEFDILMQFTVFDYFICQNITCLAFKFQTWCDPALERDPAIFW